MSKEWSASASSPVNIAVIKYWGKKEEELIIPLNSSLSGTLHQNDLKSITTIVASPKFTQDQLWLNGKKEDIENKRIQTVLKEMRRRAEDKKDKDGNVIVSKQDLSNYKLSIVSENNFPTAAGLASSASGYCCLVYTLSQLFNVKGDISSVARMGSGSACRSMYGGWVTWDMGSNPDGSDSIARQVADENHWPEMRVLVFVVNDKKKETSSTAGMQQSAQTSSLMKKRIEEIVPLRMVQMEKAILDRDYQTFADLTMKDSNDFHAVCKDTTPSITYLNDTSRAIIHLVEKFNEYSGEFKAAYTFDAGPNACIYLPESNVVSLLSLVLHYFPSDLPQDQYLRNFDKVEKLKEHVVPEELLEKVKLSPQRDSLKYIFETSVGPGPLVLEDSRYLVNEEGLPKKRLE